MAGDVTHGADPERLDSVAGALQDLASHTRDVGDRGASYLIVLGECWRGADLECFSAGWGPVQEQIASAADHLTAVAKALREQAEEQRVASGDTGSGGGGAPGPTAPADPGPTGPPGPTPTPPPPRETPDPTPTPPSPGPPPIPPEEWTVDNVEDPGDDVDLPGGVSRSDPWVKDMMATPEGRKTLQYLHDHGYEIDTSGSEGDKYYHSGKTIYLGPSWQNGGALIHEANHAEADVTGTSPSTSDSREDFVAGMIDEEVESNARQHEWGRQHGPDQPKQSIYNGAYDEAYQDARDSGKSQQEAAAAGESAGREELRRALESGDLYPTGYEDSTYEEYYGDQWDDANDGPSWWPF